MEDIKRKLGERISELRKILGLTQEKLAELSDLSPNFIGSIERGIKTPQVKTLERIAKSLEVEVEDLFDFKGKKRKDKGKLLKRLISILEKSDYEDIKLATDIIEAILLKGKR